jgi:hypothetical protein
VTEQDATAQALAALDTITATYNRSYGYDRETRAVADLAREAIANKNHLLAGQCASTLRRTCGELGATAADAIRAAMKPYADAFAEKWTAAIEANRDRYAG